MLKGTSRQVIVVDSPDKRYFDKAIFILRSDTSPRTEYGAAVHEACRLAQHCSPSGRTSRSLPPLLCFFLGAAVISLLWISFSLFFP